MLWFSPEDFHRFLTATRTRANNPRKERYRRESEQLHGFVLFTAKTVLRVDEVRWFRFHDVVMGSDEAL